jgi:hypothetical protein
MFPSHLRLQAPDKTVTLVPGTFVLTPVGIEWRDLARARPGVVLRFAEIAQKNKSKSVPNSPAFMKLNDAHVFTFESARPLTD